MDEKNIDLSIKILQLATNGTVIISGSYALNKLKVINRKISDLDIILPYYIDLSHLGNMIYSNENYIDKCSTLVLSATGVSVDIIIDNERKYSIIDGVKISHKEPILIKKLEALVYYNSTKHIDDLTTYLKSKKDN